MKKLKAGIQKKLGIVFGYFHAPQAAPDHRLLIRVGGGKGGHLIEFEAGICGHSIYAGRQR